MGHVVLGAEPIRSHVCFAFGHGNVEFVRDGPTVCTSDCGAVVLWCCGAVVLWCCGAVVLALAAQAPAWWCVYVILSTYVRFFPASYSDCPRMPLARQCNSIVPTASTSTTVSWQSGVGVAVPLLMA